MKKEMTVNDVTFRGVKITEMSKEKLRDALLFMFKQAELERLIVDRTDRVAFNRLGPLKRAQEAVKKKDWGKEPENRDKELEINLEDMDYIEKGEGEIEINPEHMGYIEKGADYNGKEFQYTALVVVIVILVIIYIMQRHGVWTALMEGN